MRTVPTVPATYIEMCTKLPLKQGHLSNEDSAYCPSHIEIKAQIRFFSCTNTGTKGNALPKAYTYHVRDSELQLLADLLHLHHHAGLAILTEMLQKTHPCLGVYVVALLLRQLGHKVAPDAHWYPSSGHRSQHSLDSVSGKEVDKAAMTSDMLQLNSPRMA